MRLDVRIVRALEAELRVGRRERIAVVELHALAELERHVVGPELPLGGEAG
jgi:hypothetical protein